MDGNGTTLIPSPFKRGDFVQHKGQLHQIISCTRQRVTYRTRNLEDNQLVNIKLPVMSPPTIDEGTEEDYFQITELNEKDNVATLKPWSGGGTERRMKVRWEEDVELIKDGLKMEDKEVFCTVMKVMGKEVMGDIKYMDKDPPIMKMPDLVMDLIFSKLSIEDRLNSRLVHRRWGLDLLNIKKFVTCSSLELHREQPLRSPDTVVVYFHPHRALEGNLGFHTRQRHLNGLKPLVDASLLDKVKSLYLEATSGMGDEEFQTILEQCRNIHEFVFSDQTDEADPADRCWLWAKKFMSFNKRNLGNIRIERSMKELDLQDLQIGEGTSLRKLDIWLKRHTPISILNLECLSSLIGLSVLRVNFPFTKSQLVWIANHLINLTHISLDHTHHSEDEGGEQYDEDEVDENVGQVLILITLPYLRCANLHLDRFIEDRRSGACRKAKELFSSVNENLQGSGWEAALHFSPMFGDESLTISKE